MNGKTQGSPASGDSGPLVVVHVPVGGWVGGGGGGAVVPPVEHGGFDSSPNWLMGPMCSRWDRLQSMELVPAVTPSI